MVDIAIVGEAWGEAEEKAKAPFVGAAGYELSRLLSEAGISRNECLVTNVFNLRPLRNQITALCGPKSEGIEGYPPLIGSKHVHRRFIPEIERLGRELAGANSNVVVALGNTAMWALLGRTAISKYRGTTESSTHTAIGYKVLPTYHPAAVLRQWELRSTTILDLIKAERESHFPEIRRPQREIWIEPTLTDIEDFHERYIRDSQLLSVDIETSGNQVTCIGFAPSPNVAIVIPFYDSRRKDRSYWRSESDERSVLEYTQRVLLDPRIPKLFQNGMYDIAFLYRSLGIRVRGVEHDTMLLHHALQPESLKGLGFLGSIYTDERAWKEMRGSSATIKKDE